MHVGPTFDTCYASQMDPLRRLEQEGSLIDGIDDQKRGRAAGRSAGRSRITVSLYDADGKTKLRSHSVSTMAEAKRLERSLSAEYEGLGAFALIE